MAAVLKMLIFENNFHEKSAFALFAKFVALEKRCPTVLNVYHTSLLGVREPRVGHGYCLQQYEGGYCKLQRFYGKLVTNRSISIFSTADFQFNVNNLL